MGIHLRLVDLSTYDLKLLYSQSNIKEKRKLKQNKPGKIFATQVAGKR